MASRGISKFQTDAQSANEFGVDLTRYYSSKYETLSFPFSSRLGVGWRTAFDASAVMNSSSLTSATLIHVILPNSVEYSFLKQAGAWKPVLPRLTSSGAIKWDTTGPGVGFVLATANNQIVLRSPDGRNYIFDASGRLIRIRKAAGYVQTLEYTGKLNTRVFDTLGGWIRFNYAHPAQPFLLTEAETSDGAKISYSYENRYLGSSGQRAGAKHSGYWTLRSVSCSGTIPASATGSRDRQYEYLADRARPFLLTGVLDKDGARVAGWTYDTRGRATSSVGDGGADRWAFSYDDVTEQVKAVDPLGRTVTYERKRGVDGVRRLIPLDLDELFAPSSNRRLRSASSASCGNDCWFGMFCGTPPMCTGPSEDHALDECKKAAEGGEIAWGNFCQASTWFVAYDHTRAARYFKEIRNSKISRRNWCYNEFGQ